jgi:hypothetical protein
MRRAGFALSILLAAVLTSGANAANKPVSRINAIGLIDYSRAPTFKVGDWVRYHMTSKSDLGLSDDYMLTVLIAGEELWWGEPCFWVETWTDVKGLPPATEATMMSYQVFDDSLGLVHMQLYQRKTISGITSEGRPIIELYRRSGGTLKSRTPISEQLPLAIDTVGIVPVETAKGTFDCRKVEMKFGKGMTGAAGDSTVYTEVRENRTVHLTERVPITSIGREDIEFLVRKRSWLTGRSAGADSTLLTVEHSRGSAVLVDFGEGLEPRMLPPDMRRSIPAPKGKTPPGRVSSRSSR